MTSIIYLDLFKDVKKCSYFILIILVVFLLETYYLLLFLSYTLIGGHIVVSFLCFSLLKTSLKILSCVCTYVNR